MWCPDRVCPSGPAPRENCRPRHCRRHGRCMKSPEEASSNRLYPPPGQRRLAPPSGRQPDPPPLASRQCALHRRLVPHRSRVPRRCFAEWTSYSEFNLITKAQRLKAAQRTRHFSRLFGRERGDSALRAPSSLRVFVVKTESQTASRPTTTWADSLPVPRAPCPDLRRRPKATE